MKRAVKAIRDYFKNESATELLVKLLCAICISTMLIFIIMGCSKKTSDDNVKTNNTYINKEDVNPTTTSHITTGNQGIGNY